MGILGILAALALVAGGTQTAVVLAQGNDPAASRQTPVVEVQAIETDSGRSETFDLLGL